MSGWGRFLPGSTGTLPQLSFLPCILMPQSPGRGIHMLHRKRCVFLVASTGPGVPALSVFDTPPPHPRGPRGRVMPLFETISPTANMDVGLHVLVTHSCLTLYNPTDCSPSGSTAHRISQARIPEWVAWPLRLPRQCW